MRTVAICSLLLIAGMVGAQPTGHGGRHVGRLGPTPAAEAVNVWSGHHVQSSTVPRVLSLR
jgi:hypothetical protein